MIHHTHMFCIVIIAYTYLQLNTPETSVDIYVHACKNIYACIYITEWGTHILGVYHYFNSVCMNSMIMK